MNPFFIFFLLILGLPTLEIYLLIEIGSDIGALPTVFLVVFTAVLGSWMMRRQGISTLMRVRENVDKGQVPALEMLEGAMLLLGGLLLLIPGFFTDALGFLCLIPPLRRLLLIGLARRLKASSHMVNPQAGPQGYGPDAGPGQAARPGPASGRVIEGEFHREND